MVDLRSPISELSRVGKTTSRLLKKLGLETVQDLLFYFPFRYEDFTAAKSIADLKAGTSAQVVGTIELLQNRRSVKRKMYVTEALIADDSGEILKVIWFNQPYLTRTLKGGDKISLAGRVNDNYGQLTMLSPQYEKIYALGLIHTHGLVPNYHLTADLTQKQIRFLIKQVMPSAARTTDWLPAEIRRRLGLLPLAAALNKIHFPQNRKEIFAAEQRLGFAELFLRQLKSQLIRRELKSRQAPVIKFREEETRKFVAALPFKLTPAQKKAAWEILLDLEKPAPMNRLLAGDVASGKTIVAALGLLNTALNKKLAVFMAPTGILARQHYDSLKALFAPYGLKIKLLTGAHKPEKLNEADIIVGTHALIASPLKLKNLALAIVDEQQHFGVNQRQKLAELTADLSKGPHFLSLSATPIPRSLALAIYGDLDLSLIKQPPPGRRPVITKIVTESRRQAAYDFIREQIRAGRQAFVLCPLIDASDKLGVKSVKQEHEKLDREIFPDLKVGLIHGRLKSADKDKIIAAFARGQTQILVATSLVEAGLDMPNASLMLIEGAERFGLAQLHQLRGRVGRSHYQSYCFLFPSAEEITNLKTIARLEAMTKYNDGFALAKIDLKLRGAGELYGTLQSGFPELRILSLFDYELIKKAQSEAADLIAADPNLERFPLLKAKLGEWDKTAHLE